MKTLCFRSQARTALVLAIFLPGSAFGEAVSRVECGQNYRPPYQPRTIYIDTNVLASRPEGILIQEHWRYQPGDTPVFASPQFDDSGWPLASSVIYPDDLPEMGWKGIGWFRLLLRVDPSLYDREIGVLMQHEGACEVYLNGIKRLEIGKVGTRGNAVSYYHLDPHTITLDTTEFQLLAIRYANFDTENEIAFDQNLGFSLRLGEAATMLDLRKKQVSTARAVQMFTIGFLAALVLIFLIISTLQATTRENLLFLAFTAFLAALTYVLMELEYSMAYQRYVALNILVTPLAIICILLAIRLLYALFNTGSSRLFLVFLIPGMAIAIWYSVYPFQLRLPLYAVFEAIGLLEVIRVMVDAAWRKTRDAWLVGIGFVLLAVMGIIELFNYMNVLPFEWIRYGFVLGVIGLEVSLAVYLARNYSRMSREVIRQIRIKDRLKMKEFEAANLREVDQLKSRFFTTISHEFRTPLTLILAPSKKLLNEDIPAGVRESIALITRNGEKLLRLVNQLLDLSRLEAGGFKLKLKPERIRQLTLQTVQSFESLAESKGVQLSAHLPDREIVGRVDREKYELMLSNLISNAVKFTHHGGRVDVEVSTEPEDTLNLEVTDTGVGVPEDVLPKIFDRYYRVESDNPGSEEGTGIGLATVKELAELHGGKVVVESRPGVGSRFTIRLPLITEPVQSETEEIAYSGETAIVDDGIPMVGEVSDVSEALEREETGRPQDDPSAESNRLVVLVVEDNAEMRMFIRESLRGVFDVLEAGTGSDGLQLSIKEIPDLIITDVMMPEMDGMELCAHLKIDERTRHIPVIMLTAKANQADKLEGLETGADDYLVKPFDAAELKVRASNLIKQRDLLRKHFSTQTLLQPGDRSVKSMDDQFIQRVLRLVESRMGDSSFNAEKFAAEISMSRMQLHRKLKALTDYSSREFIQMMRLKRAAQLLYQKSGTVSEVAFEVGFNNLSHFARSFQKEFGVLPSEYTRSAKD